MNRRTQPAAWLGFVLAIGSCGDGGASEGAPIAGKTPAVDRNSATGPIRFTEAAHEAGLLFRHRSGAGGKYLLPEIMGGGAAWLDYDGDGLLDAFLVDSGAMAASGGAAVAPDHRLFRNLGNGRFADVTSSALPKGVFAGTDGMGVATGDYDGDGDVDLYVVALGADRLLRNDGGVFSDATAVSGIDAPGWSTTAAFFDAEGDGDLDLFVGTYVDWRDVPAFTDKRCTGFAGARDYCSPQAYGARGFSRFFRNEGGGRFLDASEAAGFRARAGTALGVVVTDLNADGRPDVYVSNDQMPSFAWIARGDGTFVEQGLELGVAVDELGKSQAGMGVDAGDVDRDGDLDLWKVHLDRESAILYLSMTERFEDRTAAFGLAAPTRPHTGFGTGFADFDSDGLLDIFVANGRVEASTSPCDPRDPYAEADQVLRQVRPGRFEDVGRTAGPAMSHCATSRGAAFGDYDDDGDDDVLIVDRDGPARLLRNDSVRSGAWFGLRIRDARGADVLGATVLVRTAGRSIKAETRTARSYASASDPRLRFGLPKDHGPIEAEILPPTGGAPVKLSPKPGAYVEVRL